MKAASAPSVVLLDERVEEERELEMGDYDVRVYEDVGQSGAAQIDEAGLLRNKWIALLQAQAGCAPAL